MNTKYITIVIKEPMWFWDYNDEEAFFEWIDKLRPELERVRGGPQGLTLYIRENISPFTLISLIALFKRYNLNLALLQKLVTKDNKDQIQDKTKYWYKEMFQVV